MTSNDNEHLIWLKNELSQITGGFDRRSHLLSILKTELKRLGHWKAKQRGDSLKGGLARKKQQASNNADYDNIN